MRKLDKGLRTSPERERVWMLAFTEARRGWSWLHTAKDVLRTGNEVISGIYFVKAEECLTEALQILADKGMDSGELAQLIRDSLTEIRTCQKVAV